MRKFLIHEMMAASGVFTAAGWKHTIEAERHRSAAVKFIKAGGTPEHLRTTGGVFYVYVAEDTPDNKHPETGSPIAVHQFEMVVTPTPKPEKK